MATTMREAARAADPEIRRAEILRRAETAGLRLVRFLYCDNDGIIRGKSSSVTTLKDRLETGIGLTLAMQAFTMLDHLAEVDGMGPVGEIRLVPDPETFVVAPYAPHTGVALVDMVTLDGKPYAADGRAFLKRMVARAAEQDLSIVAAFEPEWSLARREGETFLPLDDSGCFTTYGMNVSADVIDEIVAALESQGLIVEQYYAELGWGQQELSIRHAPALRAADNQLIYRETVRALPCGMGSTLRSRPSRGATRRATAATCIFPGGTARAPSTVFTTAGNRTASQTSAASSWRASSNTFQGSSPSPALRSTLTGACSRKPGLPPTASGVRTTVRGPFDSPPHFEATRRTP